MCSELAKATVSFNLNLVLGLRMGLGRFLISTFKSKYGFFEIWSIIPMSNVLQIDFLLYKGINLFAFQSSSTV